MLRVNWLSSSRNEFSFYLFFFLAFTEKSFLKLELVRYLDSGEYQEQLVERYEYERVENTIDIQSIK